MLLTVKETAFLLKVVEKTVRRMLTRGELVAHRVGRNVRVDGDSVTRLLAGAHMPVPLPVVDTGAMEEEQDGQRNEPKLFRQRGRSKVWTALVDGREVPLGTNDQAEAERAVRVLVQEAGASARRSWRVYPLPDRPGFAVKYYDRSGARRTHRIPLDASPAVETIADAERYASVWYDRHVGAPQGGRMAAGVPATITFEEFGTLWTSGELSKRYPDHIKPKRTAGDDERLLRLYVYPLIGSQPLSRFEGKAGLDLVDRVVAALPPVSRTFSRASRRHVLQAVHRILVLAAYPVRLLSASPLPKGFLPKASTNRAKSYVYPEEDRRLMGCQKVPLVSRVFYGVLAREGLRVSEALGLTWADLDLERGVLHLDRNKTDDPRSWALDPGTAEALRRWKKSFARTGLPNAHLFQDREGHVIDRYAAAEDLRQALRTAGVDRAQLFEQNETRIALRAHDLRATFVTTSMANGRSEAWITDRTGHRSSQMLYTYKRWARTHAELDLGSLTPLQEAIPELRAVEP